MLFRIRYAVLWRRCAVLTVAAVMLAALMGQRVMAAPSSAHTPWKCYIPVTMIDKEGYIPANVSFTIVMQAEANQPGGIEPPSPDGSFPVGGKGSYQVGPIVFDEPGDYAYMIYEVPPENDKLLKASDERVYHLKVSVTDGDGGKLQGTLVLLSVDGEDPDADDSQGGEGSQSGEGGEGSSEPGKPEAICFSNHYEYIPMENGGGDEGLGGGGVFDGFSTPFARWLMRNFRMMPEELTDRQLEDLKNKLKLACLLYGMEWPGDDNWMDEAFLNAAWWLDDEWWLKNIWWVKGASTAFRSPHTGEEDFMVAPVIGMVAAGGLMGAALLLRRRRSGGDE